MRLGMARKNREEETLKASETGYAKTAPKSRVEELERNIMALLNKIAPENFAKILQGFNDVDLVSAADFELAIRVIFKKVLAEPHYCEVYADLVFHMKESYQPEPVEGGDKDPSKTFRYIVLDAVQREFENWQKDFNENPPGTVHEGEDKREAAARDKIQKQKALANIKFIGHLFLRKVLAAKVVFNVAMTLIKDNDPIPSELQIAMVCVLVTNIGHTCEESESHKSMLIQLFCRLKEIKNNATVPKRVDFMIQDLFDLRTNGWQVKILRDQAQSLADIKKNALTEQREGPKIQTGIIKVLIQSNSFFF